MGNSKSKSVDVQLFPAVLRSIMEVASVNDQLLNLLNSFHELSGQVGLIPESTGDLANLKHCFTEAVAVVARLINRCKECKECRKKLQDFLRSDAANEASAVGSTLALLQENSDSIITLSVELQELLKGACAALDSIPRPDRGETGGILTFFSGGTLNELENDWDQVQEALHDVIPMAQELNRCIEKLLRKAKCHEEFDIRSRHLSSTIAVSLELHCQQRRLRRNTQAGPNQNSTCAEIPDVGQFLKCTQALAAMEDRKYRLVDGHSMFKYTCNAIAERLETFPSLTQQKQEVRNAAAMKSNGQQVLIPSRRNFKKAVKEVNTFLCKLSTATPRNRPQLSTGRLESLYNKCRSIKKHWTDTRVKLTGAKEAIGKLLSDRRPPADEKFEDNSISESFWLTAIKICIQTVLSVRDSNTRGTRVSLLRDIDHQLDSCLGFVDRMTAADEDTCQGIRRILDELRDLQELHRGGGRGQPGQTHAPQEPVVDEDAV